MLEFLLSTRWRQARLFAAFGLYGLAIAIGNFPGARAEIGHFATGLVLHSACYAVLAWLFFTGWTGRLAARAVQAVGWVALLGALDETVQMLFPYRHASLHDWFVDCMAACITAGLLLWLSSRRPQSA